MAKQMLKATDFKKVNSELFSMTYGALVMLLLDDFDSAEEVNNQLDKIGYNVGLRIIDDFLAKHGAGANKCFDLKETANQLVKALKIYLGVTATATNWDEGGEEFSLVFDGNPLTEFVELPQDKFADLQYSQLLCGTIRGSLEMVHIECGVSYVRDQLRGDAENEIRVKFIRKIEDQTPPLPG